MIGIGTHMLLFCWTDTFTTGQRLIIVTAAAVEMLEVGSGGIEVDEGNRLGRGAAGRGLLHILRQCSKVVFEIGVTAYRDE